MSHISTGHFLASPTGTSLTIDQAATPVLVTTIK
jgi:hypothetical protein